ncbi:hypothetical protein [Achromobacter sp. DMS1]|uniref:hypothetical protein n=1 Tax=Achromobacter sp. DMS1 TaxID=1688405 RepID=UPI000A4C9201|nr:hypothetical protein [Achromobacter sp. DMS1]
MFAITRFHQFMILYRVRYAAALARALNVSPAAALALDMALDAGRMPLRTLHDLLGCSRAQAMAAAFDLERQGLVRPIDDTRDAHGEYFVAPIDERCEAARLYRARLEALVDERGLYEGGSRWRRCWRRSKIFSPGRWRRSTTARSRWARREGSPCLPGRLTSICGSCN